MKPAGTYLDSNASTPLKPQAIEAIQNFLSEMRVAPQSYGVLANPSSIHAHGRRIRKKITLAREQIATSIGADSEQLIFTSSGTEANQLVIRSVLEESFNRFVKPHWILTPIEHDSVLQLVKWFESYGGEISYLPVSETGRIDIESLNDLKKDSTVLVSCMWVNNETGLISPVSEVAQWCSEHKVFFHCDACQAWGKIPIQAEKSGAHFLTFSAHKIGGLSGVGVVWVAASKTFPFIIAIEGTVLGKQEKGRRGGTENSLGIVALGAAAGLLSADSILNTQTEIAQLRDIFEIELQKRIPSARITGSESEIKRIANTSHITFPTMNGESLVMALDLEGISVSSGSACSSGALEPSHVLLAMGRSKQEALSTLRVSLSTETTREELELLLKALEKMSARFKENAVGELRL